MRRKVGRPKVAAIARREVVARFLVTKEEMDLIRSAAKSQRLTVSEYLRAASIPKK